MQFSAFNNSKQTNTTCKAFGAFIVAFFIAQLRFCIKSFLLRRRFFFRSEAAGNSVLYRLCEIFHIQGLA